MLAYVLSLSMLVSVPPEQSFDGVQRDQLGVYLDGPGKEVGRKKAQDRVEAREDALKAARNAVVDRRVEGIKFDVAKSGRITARAQSRDAKEAGIRAAERSLDESRAQAENPAPFIPRLAVWHLQVGKIGRLRGWVIHVPRERDGQDFTVTQVLDANSCLASIKSGKGETTVVWLDQPTAGMIDGRTYATDDAIYEVTGTTTYATAIGGSKTVFRLKRTTIEELRKSAK